MHITSLWSYARNKVGLELVQVDVQATIESKGSSDAGDDLSHNTVEVGEAGSGDVQVLLADFVNSFVIDLLHAAVSVISSTW